MSPSIILINNGSDNGERQARERKHEGWFESSEGDMMWCNERHDIDIKMRYKTNTSYSRRFSSNVRLRSNVLKG